MAPNVYEDQARLRKALALIDVCRNAGITAAMLDGYGPEQWAMIADAADVRPPSDKTIALVVGARERDEHQPDDPFAGL